MWQCSIAFLGTSVLQAPLSPARGPAIALEYKLIEAGSPSRATDMAKWTDRISRLGGEGWELVAVADHVEAAINGPVMPGEPRFFYYKRPVVNDARRHWQYKLVDLGDLLLPVLGGLQKGAEANAMDRLKREGTEGWELTAVFNYLQVSRIGPTYRRYYLLKRTKP